MRNNRKMFNLRNALIAFAVVIAWLTFKLVTTGSIVDQIPSIIGGLMVGSVVYLLWWLKDRR